MRRICWEAYLRYRGLPRHLAEIERHMRLDAATARRELGRRLLDQLHYFGRRSDALPAWRKAARITNVDALWDVWPTLPPVTKDDLRTRFEAAAIRRQFSIDGMHSTTGGSTGEPTPFLFDRAALAARIAASHYARRQFGWRPGMPVICVWGSERDIGGRRCLRQQVAAYIKNDWLVDGYSLSGRTVAAVLRQIRCRRPVALYGFTSMLQFLAERMLEEQKTVERGDVVAAWNGGEMLFDEQATVFQEAFRTPLRNFYGGRELGAIAFEDAPSSSLRVLRPFVFVEIVDSQNRPVAPGTSGRLLVTSTVCRGTPFLRYEIGDLACADPVAEDRSGVRALRQLQGRASGLLRLPSGDTVNCLYWNHLLKDFPEVRQFQVVVHQDDQILLRLRGRPWQSDRERRVRQLLRGVLGELPVRFEWVEQIPRTEEGKLVQVIRQR